MNILFNIITSFSGCCRNKKLIILTYHRILAAPDKMYPDEVDFNKFTWQMELVHRYFNVISLAEAIEGIRTGNLPDRAVCLSFDDGYESCYTLALPVLKRLNLSASFFVVSSALDQCGLWNDLIVETVRSLSCEVLDLKHLGLGVYPLVNKAEVAQEIVELVKYMKISERNRICSKIMELSEIRLPNLMLTTKQVCALQESGMEIGGHTVNHPILKNLTLKAAELEISQNKEDLEKILKSPVRFFAYPNGRLGDDYLPEHAQIVKSCGYDAALTTDWGVVDDSSDFWQLPRLTPWENSPLRFIMRMVISYWR